MRQRGFASLIFIIAVAVLGLVSYSFVSFINKSEETKPSNTLEVRNIQPLPNATESTKSHPTDLTPTPKPPTPTKKPTSTPKPTTLPTTAPTSTPSNPPNTGSTCNYDLNSATGAIQFTFVPSKGNSLYWSTIGEVKALNGCKVLDGRSTDTIQRYKSAGSSNLNIPSIPPGTYEVRYSYHDSWSGSQTISVSSGQQTNATFNVANDSDP